MSGKGKPSGPSREAPAYEVARSIGAEEDVIGAVLLHGLSYNDISDILEHDGSDFKNPVLGAIWAAMCSYVKRLDGRGAPGLDAITVIDQMTAVGTAHLLKFHGDVIFLFDLANKVSRWDNIREHALIVRKQARYRKAHLLAGQLQDRIVRLPSIESGKHQDELILETISQLTESVALGALERPSRSAESFSKAIARIEAAYNVRERFIQREIDTGVGSLNQMLRGGYHVPSYSVIAGRPSMGKTAVMCNQVNAGATQGIPHLVVSLEMTRESLTYRNISICSNGQIPTEVLEKPERMETKHWIALPKAGEKLSRLPIDIADFIQGSRSIEAIIGCIERWRMAFRRLQCPICLRFMEASEPKCPTCNLDRPQGGWPLERAAVWIDHFSLIDAKIREGGNEETARKANTNALARVSKRLNLSLNVLCQLNRGVESRADKRPIMSDLRDTGALEQDGDLVVLLYRDDYYNVDGKFPGTIEFIVAKQREGSTGTVRCKFDKTLGPRISDIET